MASDAAIDAVRGFLQSARGPVSEGDVAAAAGVDVGNAKRALYALMRTHECALSVRDDGTLVYDFGRRLTPIDKPTWRDRLRTIGRFAWKGFSWLYKASLALVLVSYAVTFVLLILVAAIAASIASESEGPAEGAFHLVGGIFRAIFEFSTISALTYTDTDRYGYRHANYEPKEPILKRRKKAHEKSFIASVYDFVLGPPRVPVDERAQHKEVASFVRSHRGVLTVADVQALSGMDREEAEHFFAAFVAEFDGDAEVTDDGALVATFPELLRSESAEHDAEIIYYWDEYEPPLELTGNTAGKNLAVIGLALFNLLCSVFVLATPGLLGDLGIWLGAVPATIFGLFFAVPLLRAPLVWWTNRKQHAHNVRRRLFKAIFGSRESKVSFEDIVAQANRDATTEEKLDAEKLRDLMEETLRQVGGSLDTDVRDKLVIDLGRLRGETVASEEHAVDVEQAEVVYSTR